MDKLKEYLARLGVTQNRFAQEIGVEQATVSRLVNGIIRPGIDLAVRIESATGGDVPVSSWAKNTPKKETDAAA